jgi:prepilin-type N-terminal cleavage/methylation domain-containing protein
MTTRSSGFTLIELLVVVAILGIISAIGITSYSNYIGNARISSATNTLQQLALAQQEFFTNNRVFKVDANANCPASTATSQELETTLLGGTGPITELVDLARVPRFGFNFCSDAVIGADFELTATSTQDSGLVCTLILSSNNDLDRTGC